MNTQFVWWVCERKCILPVVRMVRIIILVIDYALAYKDQVEDLALTNAWTHNCLMSSRKCKLANFKLLSRGQTAGTQRQIKLLNYMVEGIMHVAYLSMK